jgi:hypothetical protein
LTDAILGIVLFWAMSAWDACTQDPNLWIRAIECHPSTVSALQAVAVFGAIIATIALAYRDRKQRLSDKHETSLFFVAGLITPLGVLRSDVTRAMHPLASISQPQALTDTAQHTLAAIRLKIPAELETAMGQMHAMEPLVVAPFQTCISQARAFNALVDSMLAMATTDINRFEATKSEPIKTLTTTATHLSDRIVELVGKPYR